MKHILLFGAGKSATVLIDYLKELATANQYRVTVADGDFDIAAIKVGEHALVKPLKANVENEIDRSNLIQEADIVISLLPPALHYFVALDCIKYRKHLLTASYLDDKIKTLQKQIESNDILFLYEMGLDPGIDHMSAMQLVNRVKALGGKVISFRSHCGGLVAPESDNNPWHYKISWNPKNVVLAGKSGAVYKEKGEEKRLNYEEVFMAGQLVKVNEDLLYAYYPNRDSVSYMPLYNLCNVSTFLRTTLRHPDFCFGWKNIVDLKLTDETLEYDTDGMSIGEFFKIHFDKCGFNEWLNQMLTTRLSVAKDLMENLVQLLEVENEFGIEGEKTNDSIMLVNENGQLDTVEVDAVKGNAAATLAIKMHEATLILKQLFFLGLDSEELINNGRQSAAEILQHILEKKLVLKPEDKDMIVMMHEIDYELEDQTNMIKSTLIVKGEDDLHTAMAKTVGLPLGVTAKLILEGKLTTRGLHIPLLPEIYNPVLNELQKFGIVFEEKLT